MCKPSFIMAGTNKLQRDAYKKALANARYMHREAVAIYGKNAVSMDKLPTIRDIDKMPHKEKMSLMKVIRSIKSPADFKKGYAGDSTQFEYKLAREKALNIEKMAKAKFGKQAADITAPSAGDLRKTSAHDRGLIIDALKMLDRPEELEKKKTKSGAMISDFERSIMMRDHALAEARKAAELAKIPQDQQYYMYATDYEVSLRPSTLDIDELSERALKKKQAALARQVTDEYIREKQELYHNNYLKSIENVYGSIADKAKIKSLLAKIPISDWPMLFDTYEYLTMDFRYDANISVTSRYNLFISDLEMVAANYS